MVIISAIFVNFVTQCTQNSENYLAKLNHAQFAQPFVLQLQYSIVHLLKMHCILLFLRHCDTNTEFFNGKDDVYLFILLYEKTINNNNI